MSIKIQSIKNSDIVSRSIQRGLLNSWGCEFLKSNEHGFFKSSVRSISKSIECVFSKSIVLDIRGSLCLILVIFGIAPNSIGQDIHQEPSLIRTEEIQIQSVMAPETYTQFRVEQWKLQLLDGKAADSTGDGLLQHGEIKFNHTPSINDVFCEHLVTGCTDVCKKIEWYSWKYSALIFSSAKEASTRKHWIMELRQWEGAEISVFINGNLIEETYQPFASSFAQKMLVLDPFLRRNGEDSIVILFQAPTPLAKQLGYKSGMVFPADNEGPVPEVKASPWLRKPIVQYGWDIAPRRVLVGLGEGVWITGWDEAYIQRVQVLVDSVTLSTNATDKNGKNSAIPEDELPPMRGEFASGRVRLIYMKDAFLSDISLVKAVSMINCTDDSALEGWKWKSSEQDQFRTYYVDDKSGIEFTMAELPFEVQQPYLWNPKRIQLKSSSIRRRTRSRYQREIERVTMDYESILPIMYAIGINIHIKNTEGVNRIVSGKTRTGIRKIFWDTAAGKFAFSVNQQPIFVQGANVVWARHFQHNSPYPDGIMHRWFNLWSSSGLNAVRIWGGGSYPSERFYELCDSFGIMVWQDFMFSGTTYPKDPIFLNAVEIEVHNTVNQWASHPSLLIWCGNNEIEVAWKNWGWQQKYGLHGKDSVEHWQNYLFMFDTLIPGIVKEWNPAVPYLRSSPIGNWGNLQQMRYGDNHDWGVWHGERGFNHLDSVKVPFCSEYGFPSVSWELKSAVKSTQDLSAYMLSYKGLDLMVRYMLNSNNPSDKTLNYNSLSTGKKGLVNSSRDSLNNINYFAYQSWVKQNEYLIKAYNQHRSQMPHCMGSLFWQWNDIWPGITWSVMGMTEPKPSALGILQEMSKHALKR